MGVRHFMVVVPLNEKEMKEVRTLSRYGGYNSETIMRQCLKIAYDDIKSHAALVGNARTFAGCEGKAAVDVNKMKEHGVKEIGGRP